MINILSFGHAYPQTLLDNQFLSSLPNALHADEILAKTGIEQRYSTLSKEYILDSFNKETKVAKQKALENPTDLGIRAAEMALSRAKLTWEDIGLIIGEGSTPTQTTPGESQRVGNISGLKIPAYDVFTPSAWFALICFTLKNWKEEKIPEYVLAVSSHTPTQLVAYEDGVERFYFGDGAAAIVFSVKKTGIFSIKDAFYFGSSEGSDLINFSIFGHAKIKEDALIDRSNDQVAKIYSECLKKNQLESPQILLGSFAAESQDKLINKLELKSEQVLKNSKIGNILSAGSVCTLSENYDQIKQGDNLLCALAEGAVAAGYVLLEKH